MIGLSRRDCLLGAAGCCLTASVRRGSAAALVDALTGVALDPDAAARLGRCVLTSRPGLPRRPFALARLILPNPAHRRAFMAATTAGRRRLVRLRIGADFAAGRTAEVDGWVLAETEALLAGLIAARRGRELAVDAAGASSEI